MKIRPVAAELFRRTDRKTDMTKLIVAFHDYANAPGIRFPYFSKNIGYTPARLFFFFCWTK